MLTRTRRAVSLLEVVIVAAVSAAIFLILLRWVLTLTAVSTVTIDNSVPARNAAYLDARLSADIAAATTCDGVAQTPVARFDPTSFDLYINGNRSDGHNGLKVVRWAVTNGQVTRSETNLAGDGSDCLTYIPGTPKTVAGSIGNTNIFTSEVAGEDAGSCAVIDGQPRDTDDAGGDSCHPDTIRVAALLTTAAGEQSPVTVQRSYPIHVSVTS